MEQILLPDNEVKQIALDTFGTSDGIRPKFPHRGEGIQDAMEKVSKAQLKRVVQEARNNGVLDNIGKVSAFDEVHYSFWQAILKEIED